MKIVEYQKRIDGRLVGRFQIPEGEAAVIDQQLRDKYRPEPHGNCKGVLVCGPVIESIYSERIRNHGARPLRASYFSSVTEASAHFGYRFNAVTQALCHAKKRGQHEAVVAGVPVRWADDSSGLD